MRPKPASSKMLDGLIDPDPLPSWLTEEDLDRYVEDYRDGFRGPINWYRSIDRGIELTAVTVGTKIMQPCHFMIGTLDPMNVLLADPLANVEHNAPNLRGNVVLEGAGHWLPLERPKEVNAALLDFLAGLDSAPQSAIHHKGMRPTWPQEPTALRRRSIRSRSRWSICDSPNGGFVKASACYRPAAAAR